CRDHDAANSTRSWHAHAAAYHANALGAAELRSIYPLLQADPTVRRPMAGFMEFYLLQAWFDAGLTREALAELRSYYGQMLRSGATTTWELVDRREPGIDHIVPAGRSHCHGWSAGPAYHCSAQILGVIPTAPGYREVTIRPNLGDLAWAEGEVATPHGPVHVGVGDDHHGEVNLPAGVTATLELPGRPALRVEAGKSHAF
ncbi:MAG TPA: alpha-L-rhamnosidase C-terminal domain-containing protein, partial [Opitutaceae bacterium]|nr:alpha-L-rhamnosidase C-terminal domain-containing protein [Opitutaceae bacterium]